MRGATDPSSHRPERIPVTRGDQLAMLSRLEWLVLRGRWAPLANERWFAWLSANDSSPTNALLVRGSPPS